MPIRETPATGMTYEQALKALVENTFHFRNVVRSLRYYFKITNVTDLNSYKVRQLWRMSLMMDTFVSIAASRKDLVSAHIVNRSLADSAVAFFHIYNNDDTEVVQLRHYLYILDGNKVRYDTVKSVDVESYPEDIRDDVKHLHEDSKKNYEETELLCKEKIRNLSIYKSNASDIETLIQRRNWKYQDITKPAEYINWETLYINSDKLTPPKLTSYLSQDIHGLSFSVENIDPVPDNFTSTIIYVGYLCQRLLDFIDRRMTNLWIPEVQAYYDGITSSSM